MAETEEIPNYQEPIANQPGISIDENAQEGGPSDTDSTLGDEASTTGSASITSSIVNYQYENGRRYHNFRDGVYLFPNDEAEQDRLDLHHHIFRLMVDGDLYLAPLKDRGVKRALDVGTGTGIWAIEFADQHPEAIVVGTDISPIQPTWVPPNCSFYVDDAEGDWTFREDEAFDYIHARAMGGSIGDWDRFWRQTYEHMLPGGWLELQEYEAWIFCEDDTIKNCPNVRKWSDLTEEASQKFGKRFNIAREQKDKMIKAGYKDVHDDVYKVPIGKWPKDKKLKELGTYQLEHMCMALEAFTVKPFTLLLGWTVEECMVLCAGVRKEFRDPKNHLYTLFHYIYGQKPE